MTAKKAIQTIEAAKAEVEWNYPLDYATAFEMAIKALEKQIPLRAIPLTVKIDCASIGRAIWHKGTTVYECPKCSAFISPMYNFCFKCGQALDWNETE